MNNIAPYTHANWENMVNTLAKPGEDLLKTMNADKMHLIHMAMGIAGEAGEIIDAIKKAAVYNKVLDIQNLIEELGDIEFYMEGLRKKLALNRDAILHANYNKLIGGKNARYAGGVYSDQAAQDRADKA